MAATLAAMWAEIFLILVNGGYINPLSKCSCVTCAAKASAVALGIMEAIRMDQALFLTFGTYVNRTERKCPVHILNPTCNHPSTYRLLEASHRGHELHRILSNPDPIRGIYKHCFPERQK